MAKDYDTAGKHLFDRHPRDWLALLGWPLPPASVAGGVTVVDSDVSTVSRAADKLVRVDGVAIPYVAHLEFQSSGDPDLDRRMLEYNVLARGRHPGWPVRTVAFLFRPAAGAGPTGRVDEQLDEQSRLLFVYRTVRLWELPTEDLLTGPIGTVPLAPLTAPPRASPSDVADLIQRTRDRVKADAAAAMLRMHSRAHRAKIRAGRTGATHAVVAKADRGGVLGLSGHDPEGSRAGQGRRAPGGRCRGSPRAAARNGD
jgi:hypothetical protein